MVDKDWSYCMMYSLITNPFTFAGMLRVPSRDLIVSCKLIPSLFVTIHFCQASLKNPSVC